MPKYVFAHTDSVSVRVDGYPVVIHRGEARDVNDPVVKAHPSIFRDTPLIVAVFPGWSPDEDDQEVEQATATPGEKRATRRAK